MAGRLRLLFAADLSLPRFPVPAAVPFDFLLVGREADFALPCLASVSSNRLQHGCLQNLVHLCLQVRFGSSTASLDSLEGTGLSAVVAAGRNASDSVEHESQSPVHHGS